MNNNNASTRTKETIKRTFFDLLSQKDFSAITLSEIINASTYCRSTFYKYYENKFDFAEKIFDEEIAGFAAAILKTISINSPVDDEASSYAMLYDINSYVDTRKPFFFSIIDETIPGYSIAKASDRLHNDLISNIKINDENWMKGIDKDYYFYMVAHDIFASIRYWFINSYIKTVDDLVKIMLDIYKSTGFYSVRLK